MNERIKIAVEFLKDNKSFLIEDIRLSLDDNGRINITSWSHYSDLKNITQSSSINEIEELKEKYYQMVEDSAELREFEQGKRLKFTLCYYDVGKSSIDICSDVDNQLQWNF
jgi:hypothetical protein